MILWTYNTINHKAMKKNYFGFLFTAFATVCMLLPATTAAQNIFAKISKSPVLRTVRPQGEMDVILLDSILSDTERTYYEYDEHGYLVSTMTYYNEEGKWIFDNDVDVSLLAEYTFDDTGRCTRFSEYCFSEEGKKDKEVTRVDITYTAETRTEKFYSEKTDVPELVLREEIVYDILGNPVIIKEYEYDEYTGKTELYDYEEYKFTDCIISYENCENGNHQITLDDDLFDAYCYYSVTYNAGEDYLRGWKYETGENGEKIKYVISEYSFDISEIESIDSLWEIDEEYNASAGDTDYEIGKDNETAARTAEYEVGYNEIFIEDGDWVYKGEILIKEIYDEENDSYEKKIINGMIHISWSGNGHYRYDYPLYNYEFPQGGFNRFYIGEYAMAVEMTMALWDAEQECWIMEHSQPYYYKHYENDKGQTITEGCKYTLNGKTMRMEPVGAPQYTTYSFDEMARLITIESDNGGKEHFEYLNDECDYLKKAYRTDAQGNESDVYTLYYSNGRYKWPENNPTSVKDISAEGITVDGNRVLAEGDISVFNACGQTVADGTRSVVIGRPGLYIVKTDKAVKKIYIK